MQTIVITLLLSFLFLLNIPIFAEESKVYTNQDLYKPTQEQPKQKSEWVVVEETPLTKKPEPRDLFKEAGINTEKAFSLDEFAGITKSPLKPSQNKYSKFDIEESLAKARKADDETEKPSFTFLGNEYEINVTQLNIFIGIAVGIVVVVFFIIIWKKRKKNHEIPRVAGRRTKVIYYSIFSVFIIAGIGAFSINYFRYETGCSRQMGFEI